MAVERKKRGRGRPAPDVELPPPGEGPEFYAISAVATLYDIHPQTLRLYERAGLIRPARSRGNTRLYDRDTLGRLDVILTLTRDLGVNLAGVEVILNMRSRMERMSGELDRVVRLVHEEMRQRGRDAHRSQALVRVGSSALVRRDG